MISLLLYIPPLGKKSAPLFFVLKVDTKLKTIAVNKNIVAIK
jgi:hypothetical protein